MDELGEPIRALSDRMAVMLVEHHMDLVMGVCDDIVVLDFGRRIARGTPAEVRDGAAEPITPTYVSDLGDAPIEELDTEQAAPPAGGIPETSE